MDDFYSGWEVPALGSSQSSTRGDLMGWEIPAFDDATGNIDDDWFVDSSGSGDTSWLQESGKGLWDWLKSPQGTSMAGGALKGLMGLWGADLAERMKGNEEDGPSDAELRDARIKVHNASINKPMDMGLVRFSK